MKNLINYYYGLTLNEFKKINDRFVFELDNTVYEFVPFYGDVNKFYKNYMILVNSNNYCHEVIFNKDKHLVTFYNNKAYLLLKKNISINKRVDLDEIINYNIRVYGKNYLNWKELWQNKIDYYEYQMSQLAIKYKKLKYSFDYYVGLSEIAISLLNYVNPNDITYYVCHKRITRNELLDDFFNPINIVIDNRVRDVAEYIKINYFNEMIDIGSIFYYLDNLNLSYTESLLFLSRLLYPSYYFDIYDQVIQERIHEDNIDFYTKKNTSYEAFLRKIYKYLKSKYKIPEIEWLEI